MCVLLPQQFPLTDGMQKRIYNPQGLCVLIELCSCRVFINPPPLSLAAKKTFPEGLGTASH